MFTYMLYKMEMSIHQYTNMEYVTISNISFPIYDLCNMSV